MDELDPKLMANETVRCAIAALRQELDAQLAVAPFDERSTNTELVSWIEGFDRNRDRMNEIIKKRNTWAATFAATIPDFWDRVETQLGIKPRA